MPVKISPSAREHLIQIWLDARSFNKDADAYINGLLHAVEAACVSAHYTHLCADIAGNVLFLRYWDHIIFLRALEEETIGVVAVLHRSACAGIDFPCAHARCRTSAKM